MPTAAGVVRTERAEIYISRFVGHLAKLAGRGPIAHLGGHRPQASVKDGEAVISLAGATLNLRSEPGQLSVSAEAADQAGLEKAMARFERRVESIGSREGLRVEWF